MLDLLTHFDISIQHTAGSNLKFSYYLKKTVGEPRWKKIYDEENVITILIEQAELNLKYGPIFADQSKRNEDKTKLRNDSTETQNEHGKNITNQ